MQKTPISNSGMHNHSSRTIISLTEEIIPANTRRPNHDDITINSSIEEMPEPNDARLSSDIRCWGNVTF